MNKLRKLISRTARSFSSEKFSEPISTEKISSVIFLSTKFRTNVMVSFLVSSLMISFGASSIFAQGKTTQEIKQNCKKFVQGFYDWYVPSLTEESKMPTPELAIQSRRAAFDVNLYKQLKADFDAQAKVSGEIVGLDFDPYLNAQDTSSKYVAGNVTAKKNGAYLVEVHSVTGGKRNPKPDVVPEVAFKNGKWQFVNFHYGKTDIPENENLISVLKVLRESRIKYPVK